MLHLPLRYEDETRIDRLADARDGDTVQFDAIVRDHEVRYRGSRQLVVRVDEAVADRTADDAARGASATLRFIHFYGSQLRHFEPGMRLRVRGELRAAHGPLFGADALELIHPRYAVVEPGAPLPDRLTPVYPSGVGLGQVPLRRAIAKALDRVDARRDGAGGAARAVAAAADRRGDPPDPQPAARRAAVVAVRAHASGVAAREVRRAARAAAVAREGARRASREDGAGRCAAARSSIASSRSCRSR